MQRATYIGSKVNGRSLKYRGSVGTARERFVFKTSIQLYIYIYNYIFVQGYISVHSLYPFSVF